jgi:imidazole glycerol-phosphate synthase subunit HisH
MTIALIDYGAGNLTSVRKAFAAVGADLFVPTTPAEVEDATGVVVPGVGHFGATRALGAEWVSAILARVGEGRPLLGICLGMQWLFEGSEEAPDCAGLGLLAGHCYRLRPSTRPGQEAPEGADRRIKIPHVGWNAIELRRDVSLVEGVTSGAQVYFTHSFVAPVTGDAVAVSEHGEPFAAIVQRGHVAGVQFHPEKSGEVGLRILRNFVELAG